MSKEPKPEFPPAVEARMAKRIFITLESHQGEGALDRFLAAVGRGEVPARRDMEIVAAQLRKVLAGKTFGNAFGLQRGQGRKKSTDTDHRNQVMCAYVEELRKEGWTQEEAAELVGQHYGVSVEYVIKLHKARNKEQRETRERINERDQN